MKIPFYLLENTKYVIILSKVCKVISMILDKLYFGGK